MTFQPDTKSRELHQGRSLVSLQNRQAAPRTLSDSETLCELLGSASEAFCWAEMELQEVQSGSGIASLLNPFRRIAENKSTKVRDEAANHLAQVATGDPGTAFVLCVVRESFDEVRKSARTHRHKFHTELLPDLSKTAEETSRIALLCPVSSGGFGFHSSRPLYWDDAANRWSQTSYQTASEIGDIAELLTPESVAAWIGSRIDYYKQISDSDDYQVAWVAGPEIDKMVIQHVKSGLRARFTVERTNADKRYVGTIGTIFSKPYGIPTICDDSPHSDFWENFAGLGIGTKLYHRGAQEFSARFNNQDVRWGASAPSEAASMVRNKLHAKDPYTWQSGGNCETCQNGGIENWSSTPRSRFAGLSH